MGEKGFTITELLMTLIIAAVLAAGAAFYLIRGEKGITAHAFARKVVNDVRYAQSLAMLRSGLDTPQATNPYFLYRVSFNSADPSCPGANQYAIVNDADNNGTWGEAPNGSGQVESAREPSTGKDYFCVSMDTGEYAGFNVSTDFGGTLPGVLSFDTFGTPLDSDGVPLSTVKTISIAKGGELVLVTVTPQTGFTAVQ
jgi:prepilin-type N-terminal cleavage/methylation domain-containing protein